MLNRRGFLGTLLAGAALDPERLLWVPGKKLISIPKPRLLSLRFLHFFNSEANSMVSRVDILPDSFVGPPIGEIYRVSQQHALKLISERLDPHMVDAAEVVTRAVIEFGGHRALQVLKDRDGRIIGKAAESPILRLGLELFPLS